MGRAKPQPSWRRSAAPKRPGGLADGSSSSSRHSNGLKLSKRLPGARVKAGGPSRSELLAADKKPQFALLPPSRGPNKKKHKKLNKKKATANKSEGGRNAVSNAATKREAPPRLVLGAGDSIGDELRCFADFVALSPRERAVRHRVLRDLRSVICSAFAGASVELYGSSSSGLDTFRSDLDLSVGNIALGDEPLHVLEKTFLAATPVENGADIDGDEFEVDVVEDRVGEASYDDQSSSNQNEEEDEGSSFSLNLSVPVSLTSPVPKKQSSLLFQSKRMAGIKLPSPVIALPNRSKSTWNPARRRQKLKELRALQLLLKTHRPTLRVKCLPKAKVPILMVQDPDTQVEIDIGINREQFESSEHGRSTSLAVRLQQTLGRPFIELVAFLKEFLHQFELDKPFTGGLGSFRLYMMVASLFPVANQRNKQSKPHQDASAAELLLRFFELYGNRKRAKFFNTSTQLSLDLDRSCVVDFAGVFRLDDCVDTFAMAFDILSKTGTLASIIYEDRLTRDRETKWRQAVETNKENSESSEDGDQVVKDV